MKTFTKNMLVPDRHVVELRNGKRFLVLEYGGKKYFANFDKWFYVDQHYSEEMNCISPLTSVYDMDVMKVFFVGLPCVIKRIFYDERLKEVWHREELFITPDEKAILRNIKGYKYIARDKNNALYVYNGEPEKYESAWEDMDDTIENFCAFNHLFQMVQWSDDEPWKIEDLLKLPEKGE